LKLGASILYSFYVFSFAMFINSYFSGSLIQYLFVFGSDKSMDEVIQAYTFSP